MGSTDVFASIHLSMVTQQLASDGQETQQICMLLVVETDDTWRDDA